MRFLGSCTTSQINGKNLFASGKRMFEHVGFVHIGERKKKKKKNVTGDLVLFVVSEMVGLDSALSFN